MKQSATITSVESQITVPQLTLSNFYLNPLKESTKQREKRKNKKVCGYFDEIDWSSAESKTDGYVEITCVKDENNEIEYIKVPVITSFRFTCTKRIDECYEVAWIISLS